MLRTQGEAESLSAYLRLATSLGLMTIGGVGMYAMAVALPLIQAEFAVGRCEASLPYTFTMIGFGVGGILMGRMSDRHGVMLPVLIGAVCLGAGFVGAGASATLWQFGLAHGLLIGLLGCSATFAPPVSAHSLWVSPRPRSARPRARRRRPTPRGRSALRRIPCCFSSRWRASHAASRCRCRRSTSSPTAATW